MYELNEFVELPEVGEVVPPAGSSMSTVAFPLPVTVWLALVVGMNNACIAQEALAVSVSVSVVAVEVTGVAVPIQSQHLNENPVPATGVKFIVSPLA